MKAITTILLIGLSISSLNLRAQDPRAQEGLQPFKKKESGNALMITIQGQDENVKDYLSQAFKDFTGKKSKLKIFGGINEYEGVVFTPVSTNPFDYYFKVARAGDKNSNQATITMFVKQGSEFLDSRLYPREMNAAMDYLEGLDWEVKKYEHELAIDAQTKLIDKSVKDHQVMVQDSIKLQHQLAETLQAIEQNKMDRANQLLKIDGENQRMSDLEYELGLMQRGKEIYYNAASRGELTAPREAPVSQLDEREPYFEEQRVGYSNDERARQNDPRLRYEEAPQYEERYEQPQRYSQPQRLEPAYEQQPARYEDQRYEQPQQPARYERNTNSREERRVETQQVYPATESDQRYQNNQYYDPRDEKPAPQQYDQNTYMRRDQRVDDRYPAQAPAERSVQLTRYERLEDGRFIKYEDGRYIRLADGRFVLYKNVVQEAPRDTLPAKTTDRRYRP